MTSRIAGGFILLLMFLSNISYANHTRDSLIDILNSDTTSIDHKIKLARNIGILFKWEPDALPYFRKMFKLGKASGNLVAQAEATEYQGSVHFYQGQLDSSEYFYGKALSILLDLEDEKRIANMHKNVGLSQRRQGRNVEALKNYQSALRLYESTQDTAGFASTQNLIGGIYRVQGQYKEALQHFKQAFLFADHVQDVNTMADALGNQAIIYMAVDSLNLAIKYFERTLALARAEKLPRREPTCLANLGALYLRTNQLDKAEAFLNEANQKVTSQNTLITIRTNLGKLNAKLDKFSLAESYCEDAYQLALKTKSLNKQKGALECLINATRKNGKTDMALQYFVEFNRIKDSLYKISNIQEITKLEMQYEFDLEKERNQLIQERKDAKQAWIRNGLIAGFAGLGIISFLIFRSARMRRSTNELLREKNNFIQKALDEKDLLLREIHHRVKNNLQVVSSLLSLQSSYVDDENALEAINEGRDRVQSMALIHQNLYREDNLTGIEIHKYFEKLIDGLFESYNIHPERIKLAMDIEALNLDVDTVIPLGLVVNELVSNALKYAFPGDRAGTISISLKEENKHLLLSVADDGIGISDEWKEENDSFGYQLIHAFKEKLEATLHVDNHAGTTVSLQITDYQKAS